MFYFFYFLKSLLASIESDVENLEEGKIIAETKALLSDDSKVFISFFLLIILFQCINQSLL